MDKPIKRLLNLTINGINKEIFLLELYGEASLSSLFKFKLKVLTSERVNPFDLLCRTACITIAQDSKHQQYFHGVIQQCELIENLQRNFPIYSISLMPSLSFLKKSLGFYIYQNKTIPEIIKTVLQRHNISDYIFSLEKQKYPVKDFCVCYKQTAFDFISSLLTESGIFYYFKHYHDKHILVFEDGSLRSQIYPEKITIHRHKQKKPCFYQWNSHKKTVTIKKLSRSFNFNNPQTSNHSEYSIKSLENSSNLFPYESYEHFHETLKTSNKLIYTKQKNELMSINKESFFITTHGNIIGLDAGMRFSVSNFKNKDYYIERIIFEARDFSGVHDIFNNTRPNQHFNQHIRAIHKDASFRKTSNNALINNIGCDVAKVSGPINDVVYANKLHQVKIKFYWDGSNHQDINTLIWFPVQTLQAGAGWGTQFLPSVGQTVLIKFANGNPNVPYIIRAISNNINKPPFHLTLQESIGGFKTKKIDNNLTLNDNQIYFDDKPKNELVFCGAKNDMTIKVKKKSMKFIEKSSCNLIKKGDWSLNVDSNLKLDGGKTLALSVGHSTIMMDQNGVVIKANKIIFGHKE